MDIIDKTLKDFLDTHGILFTQSDIIALVNEIKKALNH